MREVEHDAFEGLVAVQQLSEHGAVRTADVDNGARSGKVDGGGRGGPWNSCGLLAG